MLYKNSTQRQKSKNLRREPFTIKLLYETTKYTQKLTLGVDNGSDIIGTLLVMEKVKSFILQK